MVNFTWHNNRLICFGIAKLCMRMWLDSLIYR